MGRADAFDMFFSLVEKVSQQSGTEGPILPQKQEVPKHL